MEFFVRHAKYLTAFSKRGQFQAFDAVLLPLRKYCRVVILCYHWIMTTKEEILKLEEELRQAELGPNPDFFQRVLADEALLDGQKLKSKVVEAHKPGKGPKFEKVEMTEMKIIDHGDAAVVTCKGLYEGPQWSGSLTFMRVWHKRSGKWQIIAGTTSTQESH